MFIASIIIVLSLSLVLAKDIWTSNSAGAEKIEFTTLQDVYVKSSSICNNLNANSPVDLYVVTEQTNPLNDIRGKSQQVLLDSDNKILVTKILTTPEAGSYIIIIDCTGDGSYNVLEPMTSFSVAAVAGTGSVTLGDSDIGSHSWRYNSEDIDVVNEVVQLKISVVGEDIELENITLKAAGIINDSEIAKLEVYSDENNNGLMDTGDVLVGNLEPAYTEDNGVSVIPLTFILEKNSPKSLLIVYTMSESLKEGELYLTVQSLYGTGKNSGKTIMFFGLPLDSSKTTILGKQTCLGSLTLQLEPNPVERDSNTKVILSGLTGCDNKTAVIRPNPCGSSLADKLESCVIKNGGCEFDLKITNSLTVHACVDKNDNGKLVDFGEFALEDLIVIEPVTPVEEEEIGETNFTIETNVTEQKGQELNFLNTLKDQLSSTNIFFILLEITLLLIFIVLIMIMFRLRPAKSRKSNGD